MNPKPFASLNHFTVPVAISINSSSTRINGTLPGRCFDLKESTAVERLRGGRTEHAFTAWNKTRRELYGKFPEKAIGFRPGPALLLRGIPRQTRDSAKGPTPAGIAVRTSIRAGPAPHPRPG